MFYVWVVFGTSAPALTPPLTTKTRILCDNALISGPKVYLWDIENHLIIVST